jgi:hypothetical protein
MRYLHEFRPGVVADKKMVEAVADLLTNDDVADFVVDELRLWKEWTLTEQVLRLDKGKLHAVVRRAIMRYALQCPAEAAHRYVNEKRMRDPQFVKEIEKLLRSEENLN